MTNLLIFLNPRNRLRAMGRPSVEGLPLEYDYLLSPDGVQISAQGRCPAALLPRADHVIAVAAAADVSWQRVQLPRAGRQMRAALAGTMEESLLEDPEDLHFAIEPEAAGGDRAWVAITSMRWLADQLAQLEAAQVFVDSVIPLSRPELLPRGHFHPSDSDPQRMLLSWSHAEGAAELLLEGNLTRQLLTPQMLQTAQWSASPAVAASAEQWLGAPVTVLTSAQRALRLIDSNWNLRQFELAPRTRGVRALRQLLRGLMRPNWRPVRWGLAGLIVVQLLGLNLLAWRQSQQLKQQRAAIDATLTSSFPQLRAILDAPLQMRREIEKLRVNAGRPGEQDLETLLAAAASRWPVERTLEAWSFEAGQLQLSAKGWSEAQVQQFSQQLRSDGWQIDVSEGRINIRPAAPNSPLKP
jgi:general secretion pathway protein L